MNIVITSTQNNLQAPFDPRFGRAACFCLYNSETKKTEFFVNENKDAAGGAGTKAAELMVKLNVKKIISGDFGPKAKDMLEKFKIQMIIIKDEDKKIQDIIEQIEK